MNDESLESTPAPDPRNKLNDLTGREWLYALRSVITTRYPTSGAESYAHELRRIHPSPKPPQLLAELVRFFTKTGGHVLDPFAGVGGTLLACALEGRTAVGVDLAQRYADCYAEVCTTLDLPRLPFVVGDARRLTEYPEVTARLFDLILTDPPYAQMQAKEKTGEHKKRGRSAATPFTDFDADLGNLDYWDFLRELRAVLVQALGLLKPYGHLVLFTKDLQPTPAHHNMLHADIVQELRNVAGLTFRGYRIWHDQSQNLYPFGYPFAFVSNQVHQFILIFRWTPTEGE
ncbi:MAG: RsmD family RNA methyltransferase [Chloroflexales bacterium]|nr:RsmD family RNA methyltransferase [Chloroflexales bacterium]